MQYFHEKSAQKKYCSQWQSAWRHVHKKHYVSAISERHQFCRRTSVTSVINFYLFPIYLKPRIAKFQICETVKITKMISLNELIIFVIFTVYLEKSLYHQKAYKKAEPLYNILFPELN